MQNEAKGGRREFGGETTGRETAASDESIYEDGTGNDSEDSDGSVSEDSDGSMSEDSDGSVAWRRTSTRMGANR